MVKQTLKIVLFLIVMIILTNSCSDIIEESISNQTVKIITPADSTRSRSYTQTFWWEEVEGALKYKLQIVKNKYDSFPEFRLDTTILKNRFAVTLAPALYQWKVIAMNGSSETDSATIQTLRIDSTSIEGQDIIIVTPTNNYISNNPAVSFDWEQLSGAKEYNFKVFNSTRTILDTLIKGTEIELTLIDDGAYSWQVTGKANDIYSNPSDTRKFSIDRIKPETIMPASPADKSSNPLPVDLTWTASQSDNDIAYYKVYVYSDRPGTQLLTGFPYSTKSSPSPLGTTCKFNEITSKNDSIYWEVRAIDKAENEGKKGEIRSLFVQ